MKKIFKNNRLLVFVFFTLFGVNTASALPNSTSTGPDTIQLKYVGLIKNQPVFELNYSGQSEVDRSTIVIKDPYGNILYNEVIIGKSFSKKFLVNTDEIGNDDLLFELHNKETSESRRFIANASSKKIVPESLAKL